MTSSASLKNINLEKHFNKLLDEKINFKTNERNVETIKNDVEQFIGQILHEVSDVDDRFKVTGAGILKVGSFYENTKIGFPDEFGFIAVIEELSVPGAVEIKNTHAINDGNVTVDVTNGRLKERWQDIISDDKGYDSGLQRKFYDIFKQVCSKQHFHEHNEGHLRIVPLNRLYPSVAHNGPAVTLRLQHISHQTISVDIVPAIRVSDLRNHVTRKDTLSDEVFNAVVKTGSFLVIPSTKPNAPFRKTFTETELHMMQTLSSSHKIAYKLLKYLVIGNNYATRNSRFGISFNQQSFYSSYLVKGVVLSHSLNCTNKGSFAVNRCVLQLLHDLIEGTATPVVSIFLKDQLQHMLRKHAILKDRLKTTREELILVLDTLYAIEQQPDQDTIPVRHAIEMREPIQSCLSMTSFPQPPESELERVLKSCSLM